MFVVGLVLGVVIDIYSILTTLDNTILLVLGVILTSVNVGLIYCRIYSQDIVDDIEMHVIYITAYLVPCALSIIAFYASRIENEVNLLNQIGYNLPHSFLGSGQDYISSINLYVISFFAPYIFIVVSKISIWVME
ncbi:MAG: hypothetical protein ACI93R_003409 [Flavobacteriales bacterium]|jgi:hypothetical protein